MNQFLITAVAEKLSSLDTVDYLRMRADRADLEAFDRIMKKIPRAAPDKGDNFQAITHGERGLRPSVGERRPGKGRHI